MESSLSCKTGGGFGIHPAKRQSGRVNMDGIGERIRHRESSDKVVTAAQATELIENGMTVATTGNPLMGYRSVFIALAER